MSLTPITIRFAKAIAIKHAEDAVSRLADEDPASSICLDFREVTHVDPGAGWRIGNALRPYAGNGGITALVRDIYTEKDLDAHAWFLTFTRSGIGHALAAHRCTILSDDHDVSTAFRNYYARAKEGQNFALVANLAVEGSINIDRRGPFQQSFRRLLRAVKLDAASTTSAGIEAVSQLSFEAAQNVRDHATKQPLPPTSDIWSYLSLQYYKRISPAGAWQDDFSDYARRTQAHLGGIRRSGFIQVVVSDDGVGLAARQKLDPAIYQKNLDEERGAIAEAFTAGGSVKLVANDTKVRGDPGYGSVYILSCLQALQAYATLRTGRLLAVFDGTSDTSAFRFAPQTLGYIPGTTLDIVFPTPSSQMLLDETF